jgi:glycosyltransferase involved in cell wall biosynthesis
MHIAFWSPAWPFQRFQNEIITYVHMMKIELERLGHRVSVFTPVLDQAAVDNDVHYVDTNHQTLWARTARRLFRSRATVEGDYELIAGAIAAAILRVHKRDPIDLIEMEESFGWFAKVETGTALPMVVKLHGPAFLSYVDNELDTPLAQKRIELEGMALSRALTVLSPRQITLSQTLEKYALSPRLAGNVVNPVVLEETTPLWALDTCDRSTILFVGRFDLRKGADIMLNCFLLLLKERPALRLIFVGPDVGLAHSDGSRTNFDAF